MKHERARFLIALPERTDCGKKCVKAQRSVGKAMHIEPQVNVKHSWYRSNTKIISFIENPNYIKQNNHLHTFRNKEICGKVVHAIAM